MPTVNKIYTLEITPEQFLEACSDNELKELDLLLQSPRFEQRLNTKVYEAKKTSKSTSKRLETLPLKQ